MRSDITPSLISKGAGASEAPPRSHRIRYSIGNRVKNLRNILVLSHWDWHSASCNLWIVCTGHLEPLPQYMNFLKHFLITDTGMKTMTVSMLLEMKILTIYWMGRGGGMYFVLQSAHFSWISKIKILGQNWIFNVEWTNVTLIDIVSCQRWTNQCGRVNQNFYHQDISCLGWCSTCYYHLVVNAGSKSDK